MALVIFLTVLKTIGRVLLWILGIILVLLLLILFLPVTYKVRLDYEDGNFEAGGRVKWYFLFVRFIFEYKEKSFKWKLSIFGIPILKNKAGGEDSEKDSAKKSKPVKKVNKEVKKTKKPGKTKASASTPKERQPKEAKKKESAGSKIKRILKDDHIGELISTIFEAVGRLLKIILPKKIEGTITFGTGDPYSEGKILGYISMFYGLYADKLTLVPEWDEKKFTAHVKLAGHFTVFALLVLIIRLLMNKNFMRLIKTILKK